MLHKNAVISNIKTAYNIQQNVFVWSSFLRGKLGTLRHNNRATSPHWFCVQLTFAATHVSNKQHRVLRGKKPIAHLFFQKKIMRFYFNKKIMKQKKISRQKFTIIFPPPFNLLLFQRYYTEKFKVNGLKKITAPLSQYAPFSSFCCCRFPKKKYSESLKPSSAAVKIISNYYYCSGKRWAYFEF